MEQPQEKKQTQPETRPPHFTETTPTKTLGEFSIDLRADSRIAAELRQFELRLRQLEALADRAVDGMMGGAGTPRLAAALARAQGAFGAVQRNAVDPFRNRRYADLGAMLAAVREPLAANELALTQQMRTTVDESGTRGTIEVTTTLRHSSGESISDVLELPVLPMPARKGGAGDEEVGKGLVTPQAFGSAMTYARRYSLAALLGLAAEGEGEDDGHRAAGQRLVQDAQRAKAAREAKAAEAAKPAEKKRRGVAELSMEDLEAELERGRTKKAAAAGDSAAWPASAEARLAELEAEKLRRFAQTTGVSPS